MMPSNKTYKQEMLKIQDKYIFDTVPLPLDSQSSLFFQMVMLAAVEQNYH